MRVSFFRSLIAALLFIQAIPEEAPAISKPISKISFVDIIDGPMEFPDQTADKTSYDGDSAKESYASILLSNLKKQYRDTQELHIRLEDLVKMVENGAYSENQVISIWDNLIKIKKPSYNRTEIRNELTEFFDFIHKVVTTGKDILGNFPMFLILISGYVILLGIYLYLALSFYAKKNYWVIEGLSIIFFYNFYFLATLITEHLKSLWFSALVHNTIFFIALFFGHSTLCIIKLQTEFANWKETLDPHSNFKGKLILGLYALGVGYFTGLLCNFPIAHLPFYMTQVYLVILFAERNKMAFSADYQPAGLFFVSVYGISLFGYLLLERRNAFLLNGELVELINTVVGYGLLNNVTDFQYLGFIQACMIILIVFPIYFLVQKFQLGDDYKSGKLTWQLIGEHYKKVKETPIFSTSTTLQSDRFLLYGVLTLVLLFFGFKLRIYFMVVLSIAGLLFFNGLYCREKGATNILFFYTSGVITVSAVFLLGQMEDQFAIEFFGESRHGYFLFISEFILRSSLNYYAFSICSSNIKSPDNPKYDTLSDLFTFFLRYFANYLFAIYLILMASMEKTLVHSLFYSVSSVVFFSRVLLYSATKTDAYTRMLISLSTYMSGFRISILASNVSIPFYFGGVLMNFSMFTTYTNFATSLALPVALMMFFGVFTQIQVTKSIFMLILMIMNICGVFGTRFAESKPSMLRIFLLVIGINGVILLFNKFDLTIYYNFVDWCLSLSILDYLPTFWETMVKEKLLAEQTLIKSFINFLMTSVDLPIDI